MSGLPLQPTPPLFSRVLVANRGEIAVRVIRTLRALGISPVAVHSDADSSARHVREADVAVRIGPAAAADSYLDVDRVIDAARRTGAEAIHPGYGFLSENPALAAACHRNGIVFIGPPVASIEAMADKIRAKETVRRAGVSVVPGISAADLDDHQLVEAGRELGYPVLLKPSAGGGGKGMRLVATESELLTQMQSTRREARNAFADDTVLVERYITRPRHIEIQVLADAHGNVVHLGERECSLQRRHQKIVEEAPSPFVTAAVRAALGSHAVEAARACGYVGAGTVEFIMSGDRPDEFFFMEMNTRLQVEHPVTEMVHGLDLVEWQVRIAAGQALGFEQADLVPRGHAIEARVYAEDPSNGFLPTGGTVHHLTEAAGVGVRVDSALLAGLEVGSDYDPMLAKVIAHGASRGEAMRRLDRALAATSVLGVTTNVAFLRRLLGEPAVQRGDLDTELVERLGDALTGVEVPDAAMVAAAVHSVIAAPPSADPWRAMVGWRHGGNAFVKHHLSTRGRERTEVAVKHLGDARFELTVDGGPTSSLTAHGRPGGVLLLTIDGLTTSATACRVGDVVWIGIEGASWAIRDREAARDRLGHGGTSDDHGPVRSPMPGRVVAVLVGAGDIVVAGQRLVVVEAMKMEHTLTANADGIVAAVHVDPGQSVALDSPLVTTAPATEPANEPEER